MNKGILNQSIAGRHQSIGGHGGYQREKRGRSYNSVAANVKALCNESVFSRKSII